MEREYCSVTESLRELCDCVKKLVTKLQMHDAFVGLLLSVYAAACLAGGRDGYVLPPLQEAREVSMLIYIISCCILS